MAELRYLVTLVHGTFADEPEEREWTLPGSPAQESLKNALQGGESGVVEFTPPFVWTGRNSHKFRLKAADELASMLRTEARLPGVRRVLIGHSHGGNVILYALRALLAEGAEELVDSVVCLATPHISAKPRALEESFKVIGFLGAVFSVLIYFVLGCVAGVLLMGEGDDPGLVGGIFVLLLFLSLQPAFVFIRFLIEGPAHDRVHRLADSTATEIRAEAPPATPMLSLQVTRDEAQGVMGFAETVAAGPVPVWRLLTRIASPFLIVAIIAFFVLPEEPGVILGKARLGLLIAVFVVPVACLVLLWILSLFRLPAFGFDESLITRLCLDVGVAAEPVGFESSHCERKTFDTSGLEPELRGLAHSMPYQSQKILGYAAEWILNATDGPARP